MPIKIEELIDYVIVTGLTVRGREITVLLNSSICQPILDHYKFADWVKVQAELAISNNDNGQHRYDEIGPKGLPISLGRKWHPTISQVNIMGELLLIEETTKKELVGQKVCAKCNSNIEEGSIQCVRCGSGIFTYSQTSDQQNNEKAKSSTTEQVQSTTGEVCYPVKLRKKWWQFWK